MQAYADDICILIPYNKKEREKLQETINQAINAALECGDSHKVSFNDKTTIILFQKRKPPEVTFNTALGQIITKESWKYLGVTYDCTLSFTKHTVKQSLNLYQLIHQMRKYALFSLKISNSQFTSILSQAILPKLLYNAAVWGHKAFTKSNLQKISTLINSAARIAVNLPKSTRLQLIYQLTNIPPTKILLEKEIAIRLNSLIMQPPLKSVHFFSRKIR